MAKIIIEVAGRGVYWDLSETDAVYLLQNILQVIGPADGDVE